MMFQPTIATDGEPDAAAIRAMQAALRDLRIVIRKPRKPAEHPRRADMLAILADARASIDRING